MMEGYDDNDFDDNFDLARWVDAYQDEVEFALGEAQAEHDISVC